MDDRTRHRLSMQARNIEEILAQHQLHARVHEGEFVDDAAKFVASGCGPIDAETWDFLEAALKEHLGASRVELTLQGADLTISVRPAVAFNLMQLLGEGVSPTPGNAVLGKDVDGRPIVLNLSERNAEHILFLGGPGAGKTAALRTFAVSLALASRQAQVQMVFIAPQGGRDEADGPGLGALHYLPHALTAVARGLEDIANVLAFVADELHHRRVHAVAEPSVVVFVDDLHLLLRDGGAPVREPLRALLADGAQSGIYLVMAARPEQEQDSTDLVDLLALKAILRVVGMVKDASQAQETTLIPNSGAQHLRGGGDFLLVTHDRPRRFQAAFVDDYDLHWCLAWLEQQRPTRLLAQSYV